MDENGALPDLVWKSPESLQCDLDVHPSFPSPPVNQNHKTLARSSDKAPVLPTSENAPSWEFRSN